MYTKTTSSNKKIFIIKITDNTEKKALQEELSSYKEGEKELAIKNNTINIAKKLKQKGMDSKIIQETTGLNNKVIDALR
jgi:hypothetical protein